MTDTETGKQQVRPHPKAQAADEEEAEVDDNEDYGEENAEEEPLERDEIVEPSDEEDKVVQRIVRKDSVHESDAGESSDEGTAGNPRVALPKSHTTMSLASKE